MVEYIRKDAALSVIDTLILKRKTFKGAPKASLNETKYILNNIPTEDVVKVIRCKDCKYCQTNSVYDRMLCTFHCPGTFVNPDHYCSYALSRTKQVCSGTN